MESEMVAGFEQSGLGALPAAAAMSGRFQAICIEVLTARELEFLQLLGGGASNRDIASVTGVSENTVKFHLKNVYSKLCVSSRTAAVSSALQLGFVRY